MAFRILSLDGSSPIYELLDLSLMADEIVPLAGSMPIYVDGILLKLFSRFAEPPPLFISINCFLADLRSRDM